MRVIALSAVLSVILCGLALAELPAPPTDLVPWAMPWGADVPGNASATDLIEKPAGKRGPVVVRDGHFYTGDQRLRFWGFSIAFAGAFPTHEQADVVAKRLANFGINAIRFHHIDMAPYPKGIFADGSLEKLSPEALDRLDYFIATLKSQGIYSDLNLHVSRWWSKAHHWENAAKLPDYDKMVDLFDPKLIEAQKQYARDLLTHVNAYTKARYADEPAVCFIEINNENTLFLWGGEQKLAELPEPYGDELTKLWNHWLVTKYASRDNVAAAWSSAVAPAGPEMLQPVDASPAVWHLEQHEGAKANVKPEVSDPTHPGIVVHVTTSDGTNWHVQLSQANLHVSKGQFYSVSFDAKADGPTSITVAVSEAHDPWHPLGLEAPVQVKSDWQHYHLGLTCTDDDTNARICFQLGQKVSKIDLANIHFTTGGQQTLAKDEDPAQITVARGFPNQGYTAARLRDWYAFLQQTDEAYFLDMRRFIKEELGAKCPITGTIGLGALGTLSQSKTDFVDAHAYWDHPRFPHRPWDGSDWLEKNQPMVDDPAGATLWSLAATRVAGMPFTVTEYNHAAPNEWEAECVPMIAAYAALQDWDGVFLFDYVGNNDYEKFDHTRNYFDCEGNVLKMSLLPAGARIFVGVGIEPLQNQRIVCSPHETMLDTASKYYYTIWPFLRDVMHVTPDDALNARLAITFKGTGSPSSPVAPDARVSWTSTGSNSGSGRFVVHDRGAAAFVGFSQGAMPIELGVVRIEKLATPFAAITITAAQQGQNLDKADRLIITTVARGQNTGQQWDATRHSVNWHWGSAPPRIEPVVATISIPATGNVAVYALTPEGKRGNEVPVHVADGRATIELGTEPTVWYEVVK